MRRLLWLRPSRRVEPDERGFALILAMLVTLVVVTLLTMTMQDNLASLSLSRDNQNYSAALQAAEAGVQDYINRLDANTAYYLQTNDPDNPAMAPSPAGSADSKWAPVCPSGSTCSGSAEDEYYSYSVLSTSTESTGDLYLTVSGAAGGDPATTSSHPTIRTIKEELSLAANDDSLYYTKYEITDPKFVQSFIPATAGIPSADQNYSSECVYDRWQYNQYPGGSYGPIMSASANYLIEFDSSDYLDGRIESNDEFNICDANFEDGASSTYDQPKSANESEVSSYGGAGAYASVCSGMPGTQTSCTSGDGCPDITGSSSITRPATNDELLQDLSTEQDGGGCYYQGPIVVTLDSGTPGTMSVTVPSGSTATATVLGGITAETPITGSTCEGTDVPYPDNGLIYDDNVPGCATQSCDADVYISGDNSGGPITVASADDISITNDLQDASTTPTSPDVIGLWANYSILLPDSDTLVPGSTHVLSQMKTLVVDAAMVALSDSIYLPCYSYDDAQTTSTTNTPTSPACPTSTTNPTEGTRFNTTAATAAATNTCGSTTALSAPGETSLPLGFLTICGSLSQMYRGPVGTTSPTGYAKDYIWDQRLEYLQPPYFNAVTTPTWAPTSFDECAAQTIPDSAASC